MTEIGIRELAAVIVALAGVIWWTIQRSEKIREKVMNAYLDHVAKSSEAHNSTAQSITQMAEAIRESTRVMREHHELMCRQHEKMTRKQ